jgi:hypothetical protein
MGVTPLAISHLKTYSRDRRNDQLLINILKEYRVDYNSIIEQINRGIVATKENEEKKKRENQFHLLAFLYDEVNDFVIVSNFDINLHTSESTLSTKSDDEIYSGKLSRRNITFRKHIPHSKIFSGELQLMLNGNNISKLVKDGNIISGIATEIDSTDDGFGIKAVLISPDNSNADFEEYIKYYFRNKELQNSFRASSLENFENKILEHKKHNKEITIKLPKELITGYSQFLEYFSDFVKYSKGEEIIFNVSKLEDGLIIDLSISDDSDIDLIGKYLEEYLNIAKQNIDDLKVNVETELTETDFNLLVLDLKHQVTNLKHSLEIASIRNNLLSGQVDHLKELSSSFAKKDNIIHTQIINGGDQQFADKINNK